MRRLDDQLKGGLSPQTFALLYGPPFLGKEVLARQFALAGLAAGQPAVIVLTNQTVQEARRRFATADPRYTIYEASGLVRFVDTYTRSIGGTTNAEDAEYVDSQMDLNALSLAVNNAQRRVTLEHPAHRLVVDNLSTLIAYSNAQTVFRFLQVFLGRARMAGGAGLLLLDQGMHADPEVQMLKHLVDGVLELRLEGSKQMLGISGLGLTDASSGTEYRFSETDFEITGSFAAGRIR